MASTLPILGYAVSSPARRFRRIMLRVGAIMLFGAVAVLSLYALDFGVTYFQLRSEARMLRSANTPQVMLPSTTLVMTVDGTITFSGISSARLAELPRPKAVARLRS